MKKLMRSFTDKKFKYGAFSSVVTLAVVAILVFVNLVAGQLNISFDVTADKVYSISDGTKKVLDGLTSDITIYTLYKTGTEATDNYMYSQILKQYADASPHVKVVNKDPYLYPKFVEQYAESGTQVPANSLIVVSGARSKVISSDDLVTKQFDYNTFQNKIVSYDIEPKVTNAISYVTTEHISNVYVMEGHGETALPDALTQKITLAGYSVKTIDLRSADMPADCDVFVATQPQTDWSDDEAGKITKYLQNNGKALFVIEYTKYPSASTDAVDGYMLLPTVDRVLNPYGVKPGQYNIIEGNADNYTQNDPQAILPNYTGADAVKGLAAGANKMLTYQPTAVEDTGDPVASTVKIEPLVVTSGQSYAKTDINTQTLAKEPNDISGPFNLAVAITDSFYSGGTDYTTKLIFCSSFSILYENINTLSRGVNWNFIVDSLNWLQGQTDSQSVYIQPKSATTSVGVLSNMTQTSKNVIMGVSAIGVPVAVIAVGLIWWLRRRYS
ncbi:MAG: GldG family protein [Firmicutes bacterium]|nr:GldG family protein [Bacillota bacterium]